MDNAFRFLGLILDRDADDNPVWETVELLQWHGDLLFNLNSSNYTQIASKLTHWLPVPPTP